MTALGHGQRAMPEDAFKPAELQASMHDSVASQAKGGAPVAADTISVLHDTALVFNLLMAFVTPCYSIAKCAGAAMMQK